MKTANMQRLLNLIRMMQGVKCNLNDEPFEQNNMKFRQNGVVLGYHWKFFLQELST